jgi:hypothetical protein
VSNEKKLIRAARGALQALEAQERGAQALIAAIEAEHHLPCDPQPVINGLTLRARLDRKRWAVPEPHGCCGWRVDNLLRNRRVIVTGDHASESEEGVNWVHASISRKADMPTYDDLALLHRAVFGEEGWAYQVFAPARQHINIHEHVLHLFGRADGERVLPDFGRHGTI